MSQFTKEMIRICRVYTPPAHKEGLWILVDKLWPRGLRKDAIDFDIWMKDIAPSTALRQWYHSALQENWNEFAKRYIAELQTKGTLLEQIQNTANQEPVTLFYASKNLQQNHALVLQAMLCSWPSLPDIEN